MTTQFKGSEVKLSGELPATGSVAPDFKLVKNDLSEANLSSYAGHKLILNIFPSIDTGICAASVRHFNQDAAQLENTKVLCVSRDLPFAQKRFCGAENIENVETLSDFAAGDFGKTYGLEMLDGPLKNLHARVVIVLNEKHEMVYSELVSDITVEPNYEAALAAL
jgi:thioredoxin-dependent peroxiredoxin